MYYQIDSSLRFILHVCNFIIDRPRVDEKCNIWFYLWCRFIINFSKNLEKKKRLIFFSQKNNFGNTFLSWTCRLHCQLYSEQHIIMHSTFLHNRYFKVTTSVWKKKGHQFLSRIVNFVTHTWLRVMTNITTLYELWYLERKCRRFTPTGENIF